MINLLSRAQYAIKTSVFIKINGLSSTRIAVSTLHFVIPH